MSIEQFFDHEPYEYPQSNKENLMKQELLELTAYHGRNCPEYGRFLRALRFDADGCKGIGDIPFFPVRMFKEMELRSVAKEDVIKTVTSSGTTGQMVSQIFLDKETAALQQKASVKQLTNFWGKKRLPFLIVDAEDTVKNRVKFSARASAIMGFRFFARDMRFLLDGDMKLDEDVLYDFLQDYGNERFVVFGFTFMVWRHLYQALREAGRVVDMSNAILMTGGGWKKMASDGVTQQEFKDALTETCGIKTFMDHYGMSEQVGSIYVECPYGHYHASLFSDVIVRDPIDLHPCGVGERGIVQVLSVLPRSYPGHSLLTEDEGEIVGIDDCPCGRKGKYIKVHGRIKMAELRGCSDTYASKFG